MAKFKYVVTDDLGEERVDTITIPDKKLAGKSAEEIFNYVEEDFQIWLKHNSADPDTITYNGWEQLQ